MGTLLLTIRKEAKQQQKKKKQQHRQKIRNGEHAENNNVSDRFGPHRDTVRSRSYCVLPTCFVVAVFYDCVFSFFNSFCCCCCVTGMSCLHCSSASSPENCEDAGMLIECGIGEVRVLIH